MTMPVLAIGGDKANGQALGEQMKLVASNSTIVVRQNAGRWVLEENSKEDDGCTNEVLMISYVMVVNTAPFQYL